jgi:hypothetical protein
MEVAQNAASIFMRTEHTDPIVNPQLFFLRDLH